MKIIETERLYLRELTVADADSMYLLNADPEVIKYTGDVAFTSKNDAARFLENYEHYRICGLGRWAVISKESDKFIGWCGLKYTPGIDEYDLGFRFFKLEWNKGFATESGKACLKYGFENFKINKIVGRVMKENIGSARALEKIGLRFEKEFNFGGEEGAIYKLEREEFCK
jgi:RimJ/RimL family protein N-acetyltransferase